MDPVVEALEDWRGRADVLDSCACQEKADLVRRFVEDVEDALRRRDTEWVPTAEAARISGYSRKHLRRLARQGKVDHRKIGGELFFRRGSLPKKPTASENGRPAVERFTDKVRGG